jgi:hypothetical protein
VGVSQPGERLGVRLHPARKNDEAYRLLAKLVKACFEWVEDPGDGTRYGIVLEYAYTSYDFLTGLNQEE